MKDLSRARALFTALLATVVTAAGLPVPPATAAPPGRATTLRSLLAAPEAGPDLPRIPVPPLVTQPWDGRTGVDFPAEPWARQLVADIAELNEEPEIREAAAAALAAGDAAVMRYLDETHDRLMAEAVDRHAETARRDRAAVQAMAGTGVPGGYLNAEITRVLRGTDSDRAAFLAYGADIARTRDEQAGKADSDRKAALRERVALLAAVPTDSAVKRAAKAALDAGDAAIATFLSTGYQAAATADATAREQYLRDLEARNKAAEDLSDLARRAARANEARQQLLAAHGRAVRELQRAANAMAGAANAARSAQRILASGGSTESKATQLSAAKAATAAQVTATQQAADRSRSAAAAAIAAADTLIDTGLTYGAEWSLIVRGMDQAVAAAVGAATTAGHAIDATIATNNAQGAAARAEAHRQEAIVWNNHAREHAAAAAKLAAAAKAQADAAKTAAARTRAARERAQAAEAQAWAAAERTRAQRRIAEAEAATAKQQRVIAERERANAATHRVTAERQAAAAATARRGADAQAAIAEAASRRAWAADDAAGNADDAAWEQENRARQARDSAIQAERAEQAANARAAAYRAQAAAAGSTAQRDAAQRQADQAAREAATASNAARSARASAQIATGAAANSRAAATESGRAAERAWAAAEQSRAAAARADAAAGRAEAEAAVAHQARMQADAGAAEATAQEARAAEAASAAVRLAERAADESAQALWAAQRTQAEADAATTEAVAAAAQAEIAVTAALAARTSSAGIAQPANAAIAMVAPFTGADIDADFVTHIAQQARSIGAEQVAAATARANEAVAAAGQAAESAQGANEQAREAFGHAAEAAVSARDAAVSAAEAKEAAAQAAADGAAAREAAASAGRADAQAHADAVGARSAANEAARDAAIAGRSATEARRDADQANNAARAAESDATAARSAATRAEAAATSAQRAAASAQQHADSAATAAENALQHAIEAQAAAERAEAAERRRAAEALARAMANEVQPPTPEQRDDARDGLSAEQQEMLRLAQTEAGMSLLDFLQQEAYDLFLDLSGIGDLKACVLEGDVVACLWTLVSLLPWAKIFHAIERLVELVPAIFRFIDRVNSARKRVDELLERAKLTKGCFETPDSLLAGTPVLLADGTNKPIEDIQVGELVLATDPTTHTTAAKPVTHTIVGNGEEKLIDIRVAPGDGGRNVTVTTSSDHPFWTPEIGEWVDAADLRSGRRLQTESGASVQIVDVHERVADVPAYNLTVADTHTFYILAGDTAILVHNCNIRAPSGHQYRGGVYGDLKDPATGRNIPGVEIHHIPANSINGLPRGRGPSIQMDQADHVQTASWGSSSAAKTYRERQRALVDAGDWKGAVMMDVNDIRAKFGNKYEGAIQEMLAGLDH